MDTRELPTLVSFFAGGQYYSDSAGRLRADCEHLGMPHHIEELAVDGLDWGQICRLKIDFYQRMHKRYGAFLWMDVDNRLLALPEDLRECGFDMAGFLGRFRYIRDYDPFDQTRFWIPSILYFGNTEAAANFIQLMSIIEQEADDEVTDDWVLHEAWLRHEQQMTVGFLAPRMIARDSDQASPDHIFYCGSSGNVKKFVNRVVQHERRENAPSIRSRILGSEAVNAMKQGDKLLSVELARRACEALPSEPEAVIRYSRYLKMTRSPDESVHVLDNFLSQEGNSDRVREELVKRLSEGGRFETAERHLKILGDSRDALSVARSRSIGFQFEMDRRARDRGISDEKRPKLWWIKTPYPGNFGDILAPWLLERITGFPPKYGRRGKSLLSIGDLIPFASSDSIVWGSGIARLGGEIEEDARYLAVRGPITRSEILKAGGRCPPIYGDPALLLPRYLENTIPRPKYKLGLVRSVEENALQLRFDGVLDIRLDGVGDSFIEDVVAKICNCEKIVSTSLYGIIVANAYGIPARWVTFRDKPSRRGEDKTKFDDYFLSVGAKPQLPLGILSSETITERIGAEIDETMAIDFDADRLVEAYADR